MKQVCVNARTCSLTRSTTAGAALPTLATAMPDARSIRELPSASTSTPPPAASTKIGSVVPTPEATYCPRRGNFSCERGAGVSVGNPPSLGREGAPGGGVEGAGTNASPARGSHGDYGSSCARPAPGPGGNL